MSCHEIVLCDMSHFIENSFYDIIVQPAKTEIRLQRSPFVNPSKSVDSMQPAVSKGKHFHKTVIQQTNMCLIAVNIATTCFISDMNFRNMSDISFYNPSLPCLAYIN